MVLCTKTPNLTTDDADHTDLHGSETVNFRTIFKACKPCLPCPSVVRFAFLCKAEEGARLDDECGGLSWRAGVEERRFSAAKRTLTNAFLAPQARAREAERAKHSLCRTL